LKWTICWETDTSFLNTLCISGISLLNLKYPHNVKILSMLVNQPVTKNGLFNKIDLVGTSETIRSLSSKISIKTELVWNQWLAGLIDGDGSLLVSKSGYSSCEITMSLADEHALYQIKQKLGGSIKLRSGVKAIRYRLHNREGMLELIKRINGNIRQKARLEQLKKVCLVLNISLIYPEPITKNDGWFTGIFDADGTINYSFKNGYPKLTISVSTKLKVNIQSFTEIFGGNIYFDKAGYGSFKWSIQSKKDIKVFLNYLKFVPSRSHKRQRLFLVKHFYELSKLKAYSNTPDTCLYKAWLDFESQWKDRG
jgi:ubiquinol-cytochrome c reductase cytochrome b subunit